MLQTHIDIDRLIDLVSKGGTVKTGIDIYDSSGRLLLERNISVNQVYVLSKLKKYGIFKIPISADNAGGLWDKNGDRIAIKEPQQFASKPSGTSSSSDVGKKIQDINRIKKEAVRKYERAKENIKKVIADIKNTGGEFDYQQVEETVSDLFTFVTRYDNAFSYLTKEIFSYDDYLYNHCINTCTIGTAVLQQFHRQCRTLTNDSLHLSSTAGFEQKPAQSSASSVNYRPEDLRDICVGYFLHDVGKVLIPESILNKKGKLTPQEFSLVKTHSFEKGLEILEKNRLTNPHIRHIVKYHHAALYSDEDRCYPEEAPRNEIPDYVKICKLSDIYDAMTSKRCYKEAFNPVSVVTTLFRKYARKEPILQLVLYAFVKSIGICPPGSVVFLTNGQMAYILDSAGPLILPFTDSQGASLSTQPEPLDLSGTHSIENDLKIDAQKPLLSPLEAYKFLPSYLKDTLKP